MEQRNLLIPAAIVAAGVIIAAAVLYTSGVFQKGAPAAPAGSSALPAAAPSGAAGTLPDAGALADDGPLLGNPSAPVLIVEFADYQCPFCGSFSRDIEPKIIDTYIKAGKARLVYRNFAFLGQESEWAALAARCAWEQDKFWQYHDYLYRHQQGENGGAFSRENLKRFARDLGLDPVRFGTCLDGDKYLTAVRKDTADGQSFGVTGTPTVFINGSPLVGALPWEQFQSAIDSALAGK